MVVCKGVPGLDNLRRFEIAEVRRKSRNLPRGYLQADFDIVHPPGLPPADKLLAEAEVIKVWSVLCCAVLCCAVLCCAVLCCAVLCCAVLCCEITVAGELLLLHVGLTQRRFG